MAIDSTDAGVLNNANPSAQKVQLGTEVKANQDNITANLAEIVNIKAGKGITLPTADPGVAGELWANECIVTVSAG